VAPPPHPRERIQLHRSVADGGLPDRAGLDRRPTSRDLEEDIQDGVDRRSRMHGHRPLRTVHLHAGAIEPRGSAGEGDVHVRGPDIPPPGESRSAHTGDSSADRSSRPAPRIDIGDEEPRPAHALERAFLHRATHLVLGETRLTYPRRMRRSALLSDPALDPRASHPSTLSARAALSIAALGMGNQLARSLPCAGSVVACGPHRRPRETRQRESLAPDAARVPDAVRRGGGCPGARRARTPARARSCTVRSRRRARRPSRT
jgi:hypothetical protein